MGRRFLQGSFMARPLRIERPGGWYHLTNRGIERRSIFADDRDRRRFLALLAETVPMFAWTLHAYILMPNHYHLIVQLGTEANLSRGMQWLQTSYSMGYNRRHGRVGPLFQGRFGAVLVDAMAWGLEVSRYVHLNPVRTANMGLDKAAQHAKRWAAGGPPDARQVQQRVRVLRQYRWSSYRAYVGLEQAPPWLTTGTILAMVGRGRPRERQAAYGRFVEQAIREGLKENPWEHLRAQVILGSRQFVDTVQRTLDGSRREQPQRRAMAKRPTWERVVAVVEALRGAPWHRFRDQHGDWGSDLALWLGRRGCGLPLRQLGGKAGGLDYAAVSAAVKRFERRLAREKTLRQTTETAKQMLNREI